VFLRTIAPCRPFKRGDGISSLVRRVMKRAGIDTPFKGAHALRHTAATEMLRHGVPLEKIGLVLRHRGIDTTAYYAKADVALLKQIAQPWQGAR
jgi:site-specific recombinase XerD